MLCVWPEVILASAQFQYSSYPWFRAYTCVLESIHFYCLKFFLLRGFKLLMFC